MLTTKLFCLLAPAIVGLFDLYKWRTDGNTISRLLYRASLQYWWVKLIYVVLAVFGFWHFFGW